MPLPGPVQRVHVVFLVSQDQVHLEQIEELQSTAWGGLTFQGRLKCCLIDLALVDRPLLLLFQLGNRQEEQAVYFKVALIRGDASLSGRDV